MMCLMALTFCAVQGCEDDEDTQQPNNNTPAEPVYVDLGLTSGTKWKDCDEVNADDEESDFFDWATAVDLFGDQLPTKEQFEELCKECQWEWLGTGRLETGFQGDGYLVTGSNGNSIHIYAKGYRGCDGTVGVVGECCAYWTSTPAENNKAYGLYTYSGYLSVVEGPSCAGRYIRLVEN